MKVLARIPRDNGKRIRFSHTDAMTVGPEACEQCDCPGAVVIKGETDSFGFEPMVLCDACAAKCERGADDHLEALDIEDREPKPGHKFLVSECTNHDGHGDWCCVFTSYRAAVSFYRGITEQAAPYCGLYPRRGVREVPEAAVVRARAAYRKMLDEELELAERFFQTPVC